MKYALLTLLTILTLSAHTAFSQQELGCCEPYSVTVSGKFYPQDYESASYLKTRRLKLAVYELNREVQTHYTVNPFGYYSVSFMACDFVVIQPYILGLDPSQSATIFDPSQFARDFYFGYEPSINQDFNFWMVNF